MKTLILFTMLSAPLIFLARAQDANNNAATPAQISDATNAPDENMPVPADANQMPDNAPMADDSAPAGNENQSNEPAMILPTQPLGQDLARRQSNFEPPTEDSTNNPDELRLNFRNAPLDMVLNYLSDAAGFIIVLDTQVRGNVSVISSHPMTRDEAVNLLNSVLNQNGYAAIRDGRTLTIVDKNDAKTRDIPVKVSNNPDQIPKNDEIVTQIIPIRFVDAGDLVKDLSSFVSPQATVVANDAGNSIVITDTQSNIRHIVEIIQAIDNSAEAETEIRVFPLKYASPTDVATELGSIFPSSTSGNTSQAPIRFGGAGGGNPFARFFGGGGGGGGGAAAAANNSSSANDRIKKATQVTAVADSRIQAVIVTAPKDLMEQIAEIMKDLDVSSTRDQNVYIFHMNNGDPQEAVQVLQNMFQSSSSSASRSGSSSSTQNSALMQRQQNNATSTSSGTTTTSGIGGGTTGGRGTGGNNF